MNKNLKLLCDRILRYRMTALTDVEAKAIADLDIELKEKEAYKEIVKRILAASKVNLNPETECFAIGITVCKNSEIYELIKELLDND